MCRLYRSAFVNIEATAAVIAGQIPRGAHVLDVGGGDGTMIDAVLRLRPDVTATMIDLSPSIGRFLSGSVCDRVTLLPGVALAGYLGYPADVVLLSDVLHHVPREQRADFLAEAEALVRPGGCMIVKDVEPGGMCAWLGLMADRYISGDRHVSLVAACDLIGMVEGVPRIALLQSANYAIAFVR